MSEFLQSGQHPDAEQLSAFIEHALPAHEQEQTLAHLAICPHCRSIVALSMPPVEELPLPTPARRPWLSGWMMVWPVGAALAALVLAGIYLRNGLVVEKHAPATQTAQSIPPAPLKEATPGPTVQLQTPRRAASQTAPLSAAPVPETTLESRTMDRLTPVPSGSGIKLHLNQNQMPAFGAARVAGGTAPAEAIAGRHALPSGLRAVSTVASAGEVVAIDTQHTLFFSNDGGAHWTIITQPWQGRAVKVELVRASYPTIKRNAAVATAGLIGGIEPLDSAEGPKATLSGDVTDPAGASIPNASVAVTNSLTQVVHKTTTGPNGRYSVAELDPGTYSLEVEAPGFTPREVSGLSLNAAEQSQKDLTLAVGALAQTVEVQGAAQPALTRSRVREKISATRTAAPPVPRFEITTDAGEHWISTDGRSWQRKEE
jgi:Carboxypeptidase regulatory-like domain/Putative zinc-finger